MVKVIDTTATLEDELHLTLHQAVGISSPTEVKVSISVEEEADLADNPAAQRLRKMSPEERAAEFREWVASHPNDVPGLSDWAVSRDSVYD